MKKILLSSFLSVLLLLSACSNPDTKAAGSETNPSTSKVDALDETQNKKSEDESKSSRFFDSNDTNEDYNIFLAVADIDDVNFVQYPKNYTSFNLNRNEKLDKKAEELYKNRTIFIEGYFSAVKDLLSSENIKLKKKNNNDVSYDNPGEKALIAFEGKENGRFIKIFENREMVFSNRDKNGAFLYEIPERDFEEIIRLTRFFKQACDHMLDIEVDLLRKYE